MSEVFSFKLFIAKNIKFMKKKIFMGCAALVMSATTIVGIKAYHYYAMPPLLRANLEALTERETGDVECNAEVCIVFGYKNRFLAAGCKKKVDYTCTVKKIDMPNISL